MLTRSVSSAGFWSQLGHRIDTNKNDAVGLFDKKGLRDLFAMASIDPRIERTDDDAESENAGGARQFVAEYYYVIGGRTLI